MYSPSFFPSILRGHGIKHTFYPIQKRHPKQPRCVQSACKGDHEGHADNFYDWQDERGIPNHRSLKQRDNQRRLDAKVLVKRGEYTPAPKPVTAPAYVPRTKCESCEREPSGKKGDEGLNMGVCVKCWSRGYALKHRQAAEQEAA